MHFFISNLLYHLQVDVIDSEFCGLQVRTPRQPLESPLCDRQRILRHKGRLQPI